MVLEVEDIDHKGYRLEVARFGPGWRVLIFRPNAGLLLPETPYCDHIDERDTVIEDAKAVVDRDIARRLP